MNKEKALEIVTNNGYNLRLVSDELQNDKDIIMAAVK